MPKAFEHLLNGYRDIGLALPQFDALAHTLKDDDLIRDALDHFYGAVLDFHCNAYKYLRQSSKSAWL